MPKQTFRVILSRMTGESEQRATTLVTANTKKQAGDIGLGQAEDDPQRMEWVPRLPEDVTPGEEITLFKVLAEGENGDDLPEDGDKTGQGAAAYTGTSGDTSQGGAAPLAGTQSPKGSAPDLDGLGTFGTRVEASTGAHVNLTEEQLQAQKQGNAQDTPPAPRATSAPELASAPGCGTVKAALGNAQEPRAEGGRVLDVNSSDTAGDADVTQGAQGQSAADVAKDQGHTV